MNRDKLVDVWSNIDLGEDIYPSERDFFPTFLEVARRAEKILEVGAGQGRMVKILKKHLVDADFYSVDITSNIEYVPGIKTLADARVPR